MHERRLLSPAIPATVVAVLTLVGAAPASARAADSDPAPAADPRLVIARTVEPRIAYRGVPREDNPIRSQATTFPSAVFHGAVGALVDELGEDSALAERGAANGAAMLVAPAIGRGAGETMPHASSAGASAVPLGPADPAALGASMRGVGRTVTGALAPMINAARTGTGTGP